MRPERITVSACIGCGAMDVAPADHECRHEKLPLVFAEDYEAIVRAADAAEARLARLAPAVAAVRAADAGAYPELRAQARGALAATAAGDDPLPEPAEQHVTWWCAECGGLEAPQPCIGVCIRRPAPMVDAARYDAAHERAVTLHARERAARRGLRQLAYATPRDGQWQRSFDAIRDALRHAA